VAANTEGRREIVGLGIGPSEAETFWADFLKRLTRRGLRGVKLVISDAHEGLKAAVQRVVGGTWQRCRVHFMRNALAYVPKTQETVVAAAIRRPSSSRTGRRRVRSGDTSPISCGPGSRNSAG
jgi:putative transposase